MVVMDRKFTVWLTVDTTVTLQAPDPCLIGYLFFETAVPTNSERQHSTYRACSVESCFLSRWILLRVLSGDD